MDRVKYLPINGRKGGPPDFVTPDQFLETPLHHVRVEPAAIVNRDRLVIDGQIRRHLRMQPYLLLAGRERDLGTRCAWLDGRFPGYARHFPLQDALQQPALQLRKLLWSPHMMSDEIRARPYWIDLRIWLVKQDYSPVSVGAMAYSYRSTELGELWHWIQLGRVLWFGSIVPAAGLKISAARTIRPLWNHVDNNPDDPANRRKPSGAGKRGASSAFRRTHPSPSPYLAFWASRRLLARSSICRAAASGWSFPCRFPA